MGETSFYSSHPFSLKCLPEKEWRNSEEEHCFGLLYFCPVLITSLKYLRVVTFLQGPWQLKVIWSFGTWTWKARTSTVFVSNYFKSWIDLPFPSVTLLVFKESYTWCNCFAASGSFTKIIFREPSLKSLVTWRALSVWICTTIIFQGQSLLHWESWKILFSCKFSFAMFPYSVPVICTFTYEWKKEGYYQLLGLLAEFRFLLWPIFSFCLTLNELVKSWVKAPPCCI